MRATEAGQARVGPSGVVVGLRARPTRSSKICRKKQEMASKLPHKAVQIREQNNQFSRGI
jgi:hypothetical protein